MPIAVNFCNDQQTDFASEKRKANRVVLLLNFGFYLIVFTWFFVSAISGKFIWRMSLNVVLFAIILVFVFSLLRIRRFIRQINSRNQFKLNHAQMNLNMVVFAGFFLVNLSVFSLAFFVNSSSSRPTTQFCRVVVAFDVSYWLLWLAFISRSALTSYMNVKFSREVDVANREFVIFFNETKEKVI